MATHAKKLGELNMKFSSLEISNGQNVDKMILSETIPENINKNNETKQLILSECVHTADLSNPAKMNSVFVEWTKLVYQEFFTQGDTERNNKVNITMLCDRNTTNIHKSQIGFINFVVMKQFDEMLKLIPEIQTYKDNIIMNLKYSERELEKEKK
jgi:hypothetical protein